jgi:RNA polymerase sigma factor (sigma-70 family)
MGKQVSGPSAPRDRTADFDRLYRSTRNEILAYLVRRSARREDAADVLAEVYLTAWRRIDDIPQGNEARLWLYGVARRALANHRRRDDTVRRVSERLRDELRTHGVARAGAGGTSAKSVAIEAALHALEPEYREVLTLTAWEQLTPAEIAVMTGETPGAIRVRLHRARAQLRARLVRAGVVAGDEPVGMLVER